MLYVINIYNLKTKFKNVKKCSTSLAIKEVHITATLRFFLNPVRMAILKKKKINYKCFSGCRVNGTFIYCWWVRELLQPLWK
jgi:hypothetical protein